MFEQFVADFGGDVLPEVHSVRYADFLFRSDNIVSELKTLEEDKAAEHATKLQQLSRNWQKRGLVRGYGNFRINLQQLPGECQREWLRLLEPPVENLIKNANRQIRSTKEHLKVEGHKGLLLIANDGNFLHDDPENYMILVSRVLKKRKDGKPRFPHVDGVIYFSYRIGSRRERTPFWASGTVRGSDPILSAFMQKLRTGWFAYVSKVTGQPVFEVPNNALGNPPFTPVRATITSSVTNGQQVISAEVFCQKDQCGEAITLVSDGPNTRQWVECPVHGVIGSFESAAEYEKTLRFTVNKIAKEKGLQGIDPNSQGIFGT